MKSKRRFSLSTMAMLPFLCIVFKLAMMILLLSHEIKASMCRILVFNDDYEGQILTGHVFKDLLTQDDSACRVHCYLDHRCISYNFYTSQSKTPYRCELSNSDHNIHPENLGKRYGVVYNHAQNNCNCANKNMTCVVNFVDRSYHCRCERGFTGVNCETNIDDCITNPCMHNGTCIDLVDGYNCSCINSYSGKNCSIFNTDWKLLENEPICIGSKDNAYGSFTINKTGNVRSFKLVHQSGGVSYVSRGSQGNWGTTILGSKKIEILITYKNNTILTPPPHKTKFSNLLGQMGYTLPNQTNMSPQLVFPEFEPALKVINGQQFRIWFGQDLTDTLEFDNHGKTCAWLYVLYL